MPGQTITRDQSDPVGVPLVDRVCGKASAEHGEQPIEILPTFAGHEHLGGLASFQQGSDPRSAKHVWEEAECPRRDEKRVNRRVDRAKDESRSFRARARRIEVKRLIGQVDQIRLNAVGDVEQPTKRRNGGRGQADRTNKSDTTRAIDLAKTDRTSPSRLDINENLHLAILM